MMNGQERWMVRGVGRPTLQKRKNHTRRTQNFCQFNKTLSYHNQIIYKLATLLKMKNNILVEKNLCLPLRNQMNRSKFHSCSI
jgi:hypothetical protein